MCDCADKGGASLHRPCGYDHHNQHKKKLLTKTSWYRPADALLFLSSMPKSELAKTVQAIVSQEAGRLDLKVKVVETSGISLKQQLVKTDLTGCFWQDCFLCEAGLNGTSHTRRGAVYCRKCSLCQPNGTVARYVGESGRSRFLRSENHRSEIKRILETNGFAKHLAIHHPKQLRDPSTVFKL